MEKGTPNKSSTNCESNTRSEICLKKLEYILRKVLPFLPPLVSSIYKTIVSGSDSDFVIRFQLQMGFLQRHHLLLLVLVHSILFLSYQVQSLDEKQNLLQGLNSYRASLNLSALTENSNADCFADELASQFKNQPCSNTTGADTVPGTEPQLSNYPDLLAKCQLNITDTRDGALMPVCVLNLDPNLVLTNYTETQYTQYLNESTYIGAGIGAEGNWMVVVLSTNTMGGAFTPAVNVASLFFDVGLAQNLMPLLLVFILVLLS